MDFVSHLKHCKLQHWAYNDSYRLQIMYILWNNLYTLETHFRLMYLPFSAPTCKLLPCTAKKHNQKQQQQPHNWHQNPTTVWEISFSTVSKFIHVYSIHYTSIVTSSPQPFPKAHCLSYFHNFYKTFTIFNGNLTPAAYPLSSFLSNRCAMMVAILLHVSHYASLFVILLLPPICFKV